MKPDNELTVITVMYRADAGDREVPPGLHEGGQPGCDRAAEGEPRRRELQMRRQT